MLLLAACCAGGYYYWQTKNGKPFLPKLAVLEALTDAMEGRDARTNPPPPATNLPPPIIPKIQTSPPPAVKPPPAPEKPAPPNIRRAETTLEAQIALARLGISVGPIDGASGNNMRRALLAWQIHNGLPVSGDLDKESKDALRVEEPLFIDYIVSEEDLKRLMKVPSTWLGKSEATRLDYETVLELVAERGRASTELVRTLNPKVNWNNVPAGSQIKIPRIDPPVVRERAAFVRVHLYSKTLDVFGQRTNLLAHFPCSIAAKVEKRPVGNLYVAKAAANPNYLFDPEVFQESPEAQKIKRKLVIPPGPNNPVGTAWIGLDRPGFGIHGTPKPEQVGRTESHGCFRLANWNAEYLLQMAWVGMPVLVEP